MSAPRVLVRSAAAASRNLSTRSIQSSIRIKSFKLSSARQFSITSTFKMPDTLKQGEVNSKTDPSVAKQYDNETPKDQQIKDFFDLADGKKICLLNTYRNGVGEQPPPYSRLSSPSPSNTTKHHLTNNPRPRRSLHGNRKAHRTRFPLPRKQAL